MDAELKITDGTIIIDLLELPGLHLDSWRPVVPGFKGDGTYQNSPLADGRQLVNKQFDNTIEQLSYKAQDESQDNVITRIQDLIRLLEKAVQYWTTDWQGEPVWIEGRAKCETNKRYGHIMSYRIPELENPYNQPFLQPDNTSVMDDLTLIIEHTTWTENQPGSGTQIALGTTEDYDGRTLGNVNPSTTTADEVYLANKRTIANLTHVFRDDGGVFSANLMDAALPYNLLPAVPVVGDAVYFGIESATADSGPFCSLVFDIGSVGSGYTIQWQYFDDFGGLGAWIAVGPTDNTSSFTVAGVNSVCWEQPNGWTTNAINGVTAWWVRALVTFAAGANGPTQRNRDVYSVIWPYIEIQDTDVGGDIPAILKIRLRDRGNSILPATADVESDRVVCGLRSTSRGENFTSYLNVGSPNDQNPTGVTVTLGANTAYLSGFTVSEYITSSIAAYTPVGVEALADRVTFTLSSSLMQEYYGDFHVFLRGIKVGSTDEISIRLGAIVGSGGIETYTDTQYVTNAPAIKSYVFDLGKINIPAGKLNNDETGDQTELVIQCGSDGATDSFYIMDLILIPVDEWSGDFSLTNNNTDGYLKEDTYIILDSIERPKDYIRSILFNTSDQAIAFYQSITNGRAILQSNGTQRLWFLFSLGDESTFESIFTVQLFKNQQYTSMRGNR